MIVEDSPAVADVHRRLVELVPGFVYAGSAGTAADARQLVARVRPHLLLLDLGLPDGNGVSFLRGLRGARDPVEVIAVTATRDAGIVRECVHLGVVDYLVKPFAPERLRQALGLFAHRMQALRDGQLAQADVDALCASGRRAARALPRELTPETLATIRDALRPGGLSAAEVAERTGVSRVTARRYLEYLATAGEATIDTVADGPGRPVRRFVRTPVNTTATRIV